MAQDIALIISITMLCMLSPGPDMVLVMRNTLAGDRKSGLSTSLGVGMLVAHSIVAYSVLKFAGAAYLIFLGVSGFRNAKANDPLGTVDKPEARTGSSYLQGLLNNLLNPKGALFYLGVFTQVIRPGTAPARTLLLVLAMVATSALFWVMFVCTLHLPSVRGLLTRSRRTLERGFGVLLVLFGLRVAAQD